MPLLLKLKKKAAYIVALINAKIINLKSVQKTTYISHKYICLVHSQKPYLLQPLAVHYLHFSFNRREMFWQVVVILQSDNYREEKFIGDKFATNCERMRFRCYDITSKTTQWEEETFFYRGPHKGGLAGQA